MVPLLLGCTALGLRGDDGEIPTDGGPPGLFPEEPAPSAFVAAGESHLKGLARGMKDVKVGDRPLDVEGGRYHGHLDLDRGIETFELTATGPDGAPAAVTYSVLAGEFAPADGNVAGAARVHVSEAGLEALGPVIEDLLDPAALLGTSAGELLYEDGEMTVYLDGITLGAIEVSAIPQDGALLLGLGLSELTVQLSVETEILIFIPIGLEAEVRLTDAELRMKLVPGVDGQGGLTLEVEDPGLEYSGVELDVDGIADFLEDLFMSDADVAAMLEEELDPLLEQVPALVDDLLAELDELGQLEVDLLDAHVTVSPWFAAATVDEDGLDLDVDLAVDVSGAGEDARFLVSGAPGAPEGGELAVALADDLVNRALAEMWAAGALDLELPLEPGSIEAAALLLFGGSPVSGGNLSVSAGLPPVLVERDGQARLQLGEMKLGVDVPGGTYGERLDLVLHADAALDLSLTADALGVVLSDAQVTLAPGGEADPILLAQLPTLEAGLAAGIAVLNGMLTFPLDDLAGGSDTTSTGAGEDSLLAGLSLPPVEISRQPDGKATRLEFTLTGWDPSL